jgi:hypothetical protein
MRPTVPNFSPNIHHNVSDFGTNPSSKLSPISSLSPLQSRGSTPRSFPILHVMNDPVDLPGSKNEVEDWKKMGNENWNMKTSDGDKLMIEGESSPSEKKEVPVTLRSPNYIFPKHSNWIFEQLPPLVGIPILPQQEGGMNIQHEVNIVIIILLKKGF